MEWEQKTEEKFKTLLTKLPFFHRHIAEKVVIKKAEELAAQRNSAIIQEDDLAQAFRTEVPEVFKSYLEDLLKDVDLK